MSGIAPPNPPRPPTPDDASEADASAINPWVLVWTIVVAKAGTIVIIILAAHSFEAGALIATTSLPWVVSALALAAGPLLFRYRLRRVRARRAELRRAEWMLPPTELPTPGSASPRRR